MLAICFLFNLSVNTFATTEQDKKICDKMVAIKIIEEKYLEVNANQTFSISNEASKEIDKETLASIRFDMNSINSCIAEGILQTNIKTGEITQTAKFNSEIKANNFMIAAAGLFAIQYTLWIDYCNDAISEGTGVTITCLGSPQIDSSNITNLVR